MVGNIDFELFHRYSMEEHLLSYTQVDVAYFLPRHVI